MVKPVPTSDYWHIQHSKFVHLHGSLNESRIISTHPDIFPSLKFGFY